MNSLYGQLVCPVTHASDVAAARRAGARLASELGFSETRAAQLALIVTEAGTNLVKHAGTGTVYLSPAQAPGGIGIEVLAVDSGPGIIDLDACLRDGISSAGTSGTGLGALRRLSDDFDAWSAPGLGAVFFMRLWREAPTGAPVRQPLAFGALTQALAGEEVCGDAWGVAFDANGATLLASDGLGHGPDAQAASAAALAQLAHLAPSEPGPLTMAVHGALRPTRGVALATLRIDLQQQQLRFTGIGNIAAYVFDDSGRRALVSHNGIVGHNLRKLQEFALPFAPGALCILHSDGIQSQWDLTRYPGLLARTPALIAALLMRDFIRLRDDAMVLVLRHAEGGI